MSGAGRNGRVLGRLARRGRRHGGEKVSTKISMLVGCVLVYGWFYRVRSVQQTGGGTSDPFWNVQHK